MISAEDIAREFLAQSKSFEDFWNEKYSDSPTDLKDEVQSLIMSRKFG